jgi:MATE family multidrug resistance protein
MSRPRSLNRQILGLAVPSILANITVPFVGIVDLAIAGHLGDAAAIGGIAVGTMLFDMLYWNVGFLRVGTGGITAQAYGRRDWKCAAETFVQGIATSLLMAFLCLVIQWLYVWVSFLVLDCTPEVASVAKEYFFIRIWAVPATMSLFVFKGWFIGMQNTVYSMITDIWVNVVNMVASWLLAFHTPLGLKGVAVGTLIAQWTGLALASLLLLGRYRSIIARASIRHAIRWQHIRSFFRINLDLFIRSFSMLVVYNGFTIIATYYGDTQLAVSAVMMKLLLLYSYFVDGFAYAGEALTGRFIGEQDKAQLHRVIRLLFWWCLGIAAVSTLAYAVIPQTLIGIITDDPAVHAGCKPFLFWLLLMPVFSCIAFVWDGIYIGATASRALRNGTVGSAVAFLAVYFLCARFFGIQSLYIAYFAHLIWRSAYQTLFARREVYARVP